MVNAAVLVSGGGANLQAILDAYHFSEIKNCTIAAVISSAPDAYALKRAETAGVPAYIVERNLFPNHASFSNALLNKLQDLDIELVITAGFKERLSYTILHKYKNRVINVQPTLFPAYCQGYFDPVYALGHMIKTGVRITGATSYFMTEEDDGTGPIIEQRAVNVLSEDTIATLQERIMREAEWSLLPRAISLFCEGRLEIRGERVLISEAAEELLISQP